MARPLRIERAGAWHHVTARGNERRPIYRDRRDRDHFCELLAEAGKVFHWRLHAYVLMDNHFHLLVETPEANLSRAMQWLNVSYSVWFNRRHARCGHLFQGRFKSIIVEPEAWGLELSRYIHLNPVRVGRFGLDKRARTRDHAGLGDKPDAGQIAARLEELRRYPWSSYRAYAGLSSAPNWLSRETLLARTGAKTPRRRADSYRQFVEEAIRQGLAESPWEKLEAGTALGGARFLAGVKRALRVNPREQTAARRWQKRPSLREVIAAVEKEKREKWPDFQNRHGDWGRDLVFYVGRKLAGLKTREMAEAMGGLDYMAVSMAIHRFGRRLERDPAVRAALERCRAQINC